MQLLANLTSLTALFRFCQSFRLSAHQAGAFVVTGKPIQKGPAGGKGGEIKNWGEGEGGGILIEEIKNTSLVLGGQEDCLCPLGKFWHWRQKTCIDQGGSGFVCGVFPKEHHHRVCQDGLVCKGSKGAKDNDSSHGSQKKEAKSTSATCIKCTAKDKCKTGEERHAVDCVKKIVVSGKSCSTVKVTLPAIAKSATQTRAHTAKEKVTKEVTREAEYTATRNNGDIKRTAKAKATESYTASDWGTGRHRATANVSKRPEATVKACVTAAEARKLVGLIDDQRVGSVLAAEMLSAARERSFQMAVDRAAALAMKIGGSAAKRAAREVAAVEAAEMARMKAEAMARKGAAWKAEAAAGDAAFSTAKALAKERAEAAADAAAAKAKEEGKDEVGEKEKEEEKEQEDEEEVEEKEEGKEKATTTSMATTAATTTTKITMAAATAASTSTMTLATAARTTVDKEAEIAHAQAVSDAANDYLGGGPRHGPAMAPRTSSEKQKNHMRKISEDEYKDMEP